MMLRLTRTVLVIALLTIVSSCSLSRTTQQPPPDPIAEFIKAIPKNSDLERELREAQKSVSTKDPTFHFPGDTI